MKFYFISAVQSSVRNKYNSQIQKQPTQQSISTNNFSNTQLRTKGGVSRDIRPPLAGATCSQGRPPGQKTARTKVRLVNYNQAGQRS